MIFNNKKSLKPLICCIIGGAPGEPGFGGVEGGDLGFGEGPGGPEGPGASAGMDPGAFLGTNTSDFGLFGEDSDSNSFLGFLANLVKGKGLNNNNVSPKDMLMTTLSVFPGMAQAENISKGLDAITGFLGGTPDPAGAGMPGNQAGPDIQQPYAQPQQPEPYARESYSMNMPQQGLMQPQAPEMAKKTAQNLNIPNFNIQDISNQDYPYEAILEYILNKGKA